MSDDNFEPLTIDLSDQTHLRFNGPNEIINWINKEQQEFGWLQEGGSRAAGGAQNVASIYANGFGGMRQAFNNWSANLHQESLRNALVNSIQGFYGNNLVVRSDHQFARIAKDVNAKDGAIAASAAFAFLFGLDCQVNFQTLKGLIAAKLIRDGITPKSHELVADAISDLNSAAKSQMNSNATEWSTFTATCDAQLKATDERFKNQVSDFIKATDQTFSRVNDSVDAALKSIRTTEETYKEQMKLQAPVEYWEAKAEKHTKALAERLSPLRL
jgi:hypothetical protein